MISYFIAGTIASTLHVISGPDHLAAVTPLVVESEKKGWKIGLTWGLGHLSGMLLIGFLFLIFKEYIPIEQISKYSEQLVGVVLIGVGLWSILKTYSKKSVHSHPHIHTDQNPYVHQHIHAHSNESHNHNHTSSIKQTLYSSYSIGFLHGLAGVAHFFLLLPILGFSTMLDGMQYIIGFAVGTVLAMAIYTLLLSNLILLSKNSAINFSFVRISAGLLSILVGFYWLFFL